MPWHIYEMERQYLDDAISNYTFMIENPDIVSSLAKMYDGEYADILSTDPKTSLFSDISKDAMFRQHAAYRTCFASLAAAYSQVKGENSMFPLIIKMAGGYTTVCADYHATLFEWHRSRPVVNSLVVRAYYHNDKPQKCHYRCSNTTRKDAESIVSALSVMENSRVFLLQDGADWQITVDKVHPMHHYASTAAKATLAMLKKTFPDLAKCVISLPQKSIELAFYVTPLVDLLDERPVK